MKITLNTSEILDALYADSALTTLAIESPESIAAHILSPDQEKALLRMARDATIATLALSPERWCVSSNTSRSIIVEAPDNIRFDPVTTNELLRVAITAMMQCMIYRLNGYDNSPTMGIAASIMKNLSDTRHFTTKITPQ